MEKVKNILSSVLFGVFGCALSICIAPIAAVVIIGYMTKVSFEIGYKSESLAELNKHLEEEAKKLEKSKQN